ncbi:transcription antitermination factor NusG [Rhizobium sp. BK591]|uniref:transcription termination/antitermination NusG family protein n=1 Tax=Rhizobium sp. BK591 TaxID=2586985 RepID=UPI00161CBC06|nr:transcription termination/antitermination NusG family protein [Rhizobium sp. BK591]MBB3745015.1 transcription antitermination factor NusG [Rhizobium sp. BK591]
MNEKINISGQPFEFENVDSWGRGVRFGFVVAVSDGKGGKKAWGDQIFQSQPAAVSTAQACVRPPYEILPAREIVHFGTNPQSHSYRRSILINDPIGDPAVRWYAIRVAPGYQRMAKAIEGAPEDRRGESIIERNLRNEGIDVFMPAFWKEIRKHRSRKLFERRLPLLVGYAFIRRDPGDGFDRVRQVDGVGGIVSVGRDGGPIAFTEADMQALMLSGFDKQQAYRFAKASATEEARHKRRKHLNTQLGRLLPRGRGRTVSLRYHAENTLDQLNEKLKAHVLGIMELLDGLEDDTNLDEYREAV